MESPAEEAPRKKSMSPTRAWSRPYGLAGCGWGSQVMGKRGGQISAATTNGTSANQFFAITFGTSNCVEDENNEVAHRLDLFILGNKVALADDVARGSGETLSGLAQIMGCGDQNLLNSKLQANFSKVFPNNEVVANEVSDSVVTVILQDGELLNSCTQIAQVANN